MDEQSMTERLAAIYWSYSKMTWSWGNIPGSCFLAIQAFAYWMGWSRIAQWVNTGLVSRFVTRNEWCRIWESVAAEGNGK